MHPVALLKELDGLNERGVSISNLRISNRAQVILPYHLAQDEYEERRRGDNKIGTTKKGIGPAYVDKAQRIGIRMADLLEKETFERRLKENIEVKMHTSKACLMKLAHVSMKSLMNTMLQVNV